jgi:hypothetical protein
MARCDTLKQAKEQDDANIWCRSCWRAYVDSDEEAPCGPCHDCGAFHLRELMFGKVDGYRCRSCAKKYEVALLAKMTSATVVS